MMHSELLKAYWAQQNDLPIGFTRLEWIKSNGTSTYIDTGINAQINAELELDGYWATNSELQNICGARYDGTGSSSIMGFILIGRSTQNGLIYNYCNTEYEAGILKSTALARHNFVSHLYVNDQWISFDGVRGTVRTVSTTKNFADVTFFLFARSQNGTPNTFGEIYAYGIKLTTDSSLVRDYIPALARVGTTYTDGNTGNQVTVTGTPKPGMFDKVSKRFFVNQGTGEFSYA